MFEGDSARTRRAMHHWDGGEICRVGGESVFLLVKEQPLTKSSVVQWSD